MKRCSYILSILAASVLGAFSQKNYYIPKPQLLLSHKTRNELITSVGYGKGLNFGVSYSVLDNVALFTTGTLDYSTRMRRTIIFGDKYMITSQDYVFNGGLGYFVRQNFSFEVLAGFGINRVSNSWFFTDHSEERDYTNASYNGFFGQINLSKVKAQKEFGLSTRISTAKYKNVEFFDSWYYASGFKSYYYDFWISFLEPSIFWGYTFDRFTISMLLGVSIPLDYPNLHRFDVYPDETIKHEHRDKLGHPSLIGGVCLKYFFDPFKKQKP